MTLTLHLDPGTISGLAEGAAVATFPDVSGWVRDFVQATPGSQPTYSAGGLNGLPGVIFDGAASEMEHAGGSLASYLGVTAGAWIVVVKPSAVAAPGSTSTWDSVGVICDQGGFWGLYLRDTPESRTLWWDGSGSGGTEPHVVLGAPLNAVSVLAGYYDGGRLYASINGGPFSSATAGGLADLTSRPVIGRNHTSNRWLQGILGDVLVWDVKPSDFDSQIQGVIVRYGANQPAGQAAARNIGSRYLWRFRRPVPQPKISVPLHRGLALEAGDLITVSHSRLPARGAGSAGTAKGERWAGRIQKKNVNRRRVGLELREFRPVRLWYRPLVSLTGAAQQEGVALILSGQTWTFTRAAAATITDPGGSGSISIGANVPRIDSRGHFFTLGDQLLASNNTTARLWPADRGSCRMLIVPNFNTADVAGDVVPFLAVDYDAANKIRLVYDGTAGEFQFERTRAGVTTNAIKAATLVQYTAVDVVARWTGTEGELDQAAYSASLVVDGVAGAAVAAAGPTIETTTSAVEIMGGDSASAESWLQSMLLTLDVLTDEEAAREV